MPQAIDCAATPWQKGTFRGRAPQLLFGTMYEDPQIELRAFAPNGHIFCIAGAGCTARFLAAAGHRVSAVDINPEQIAYAESRASGAVFVEGAAEHLLTRGRGLLALAGWTESKRREFLSLDDVAAQIEYWQQTLDSGLFRAGVDTLLSHWLLRLVYASPFVSSLPRGFGAIVRARLARGWATHPNRSNPYAWHLLLGEGQAEPSPALGPIQFECADAATYLESCPRSGFDGFALSNILDGAPPTYVERLNAAVRRAAAPGAVVVARSFAEPVASAAVSNQAARDRSLLWGIVDVRGVD